MGLSKTQQEYVSNFLGDLFAQGTRYEELFRKLCKQGCESETLSGLLFGVCIVAVGYSEGILPRIIFSAAQVKKLAKDLRSLSTSVDRINKSMLNPKYDLLWAPPDAKRDMARIHLARRYDTLPGVMMAYSFHLERYIQFTRRQLKRMTLTHFLTLQLLQYVEGGTGSPRYEDMSDLLTAGFLVSGGTEARIPKLFSADALAKLKQRKVIRRNEKA